MRTHRRSRFSPFDCARWPQSILIDVLSVMAQKKKLALSVLTLSCNRQIPFESTVTTQAGKVQKGSFILSLCFGAECSVFSFLY